MILSQHSECCAVHLVVHPCYLYQCAYSGGCILCSFVCNDELFFSPFKIFVIYVERGVCDDRVFGFAL